MNTTHPELLSRDGIETRQLTKLKVLCELLEQHNSFWKKRFADADFNSAQLVSLNDLKSLPFLTKQELVADQNQHPKFGTNLTFPTTDYCRLHQTSGTTGKPMRWLDTRTSWDWFMNCWQQIYRIVGVTAEDIFAFPFSFGPFIGFWAAFEGAQRMGNLSLTMGGMTSEARLKMILEMNATVICCTPTYALRLCDVATELGIDLGESDVRLIIVAGEPGGAIPAIRQRLESTWNARIIDHWGMTDIGSLGIEPVDGPGGLLILETECIAEIIDLKTETAVEPGELGELVITNLGRIGQPVLRYRTGDLVRASNSTCPSGYHLLRLEGGILGRADDMVTIRGNNVFPSSVDAILREIEQVAEYRITVQTRRSMPHLRLEIEPVPQVEDIQRLLAQVQQRIKDQLNFQAEVIGVPVDFLPRFELKGRRFFREETCD